jgi:hypothetical protein
MLHRTQMLCMLLSIGALSSSPQLQGAPDDDIAERLAACAACHGERGRSRSEGVTAATIAAASSDAAGRQRGGGSARRLGSMLVARLAGSAGAAGNGHLGARLADAIRRPRLVSRPRRQLHRVSYGARRPGIRRRTPDRDSLRRRLQH